MRKLKNILITGGAGFIGCNFIHYLFGLSNSGTELFGDANFTGNVINVDCLTYAGNLESLKDVEEKYGGKRYFFEKVDITDRAEIERIFKQYDIDTVIHFAAESHCLEAVTLLLPLTTGFTSTDPTEVMNHIIKQIEAEKPKEKPVVTLTRGERKICDKRRDDGKQAFNKKNYEKAIEFFTSAFLSSLPIINTPRPITKAPPTMLPRVTAIKL